MAVVPVRCVFCLSVLQLWSFFLSVICCIAFLSSMDKRSVSKPKFNNETCFLCLLSITNAMFLQWFQHHSVNYCTFHHLKHWTTTTTTATTNKTKKITDGPARKQKFVVKIENVVYWLLRVYFHSNPVDIFWLNVRLLCGWVRVSAHIASFSGKGFILLSSNERVKPVCFNYSSLYYQQIKKNENERNSKQELVWSILNEL